MSTKILFRLATVVAFICGTATAVAAAANTTWPACYVIGNDYDGDDVISGLRFSEDDCANWCLTVGTRYIDLSSLYLCCT